MKIFDLGDYEPQAGGMVNWTTVQPSTFSTFEPKVSKNILDWLDNQQWPTPGAMEIIAAIRIRTPSTAGPWYYGDGVSSADVTPAMKVVGSNCSDLWLCAEKRLVMKVISVFHIEIDKVTTDEEDLKLHKDIQQRMECNLTRHTQVEALKLQRQLKELERIQGTISAQQLLLQVLLQNK